MLYIVATPIGNLEDLSFRGLKVLKEVDVIVCEDTRKTKILLNHYQIKKPLLSYFQHSKLKSLNKILELLRNGKKIALVSEAGTPSISDPGSKLIDYLTNQLPNLKIIPIPGPSALITAASISGLPVDRFLFLGFLPVKKRRKRFLEEIENSKYTTIFYESPYRILKTLEELKNFLGERKVVVARELTKKFETIYRGKIEEVIEKIKKDKIKGEFVVLIEGKK